MHVVSEAVQAVGQQVVLQHNRQEDLSSAYSIYLQIKLSYSSVSLLVLSPALSWWTWRQRPTCETFYFFTLLTQQYCDKLSVIHCNTLWFNLCRATEVLMVQLVHLVQEVLRDTLYVNSHVCVM